MFSTKISGLAVDTDYSFHLVLRTSGGTYSSNTLNVRTHKMTDLTGIVVTPGVLPPQLRESLETAVERIGGRIVDSVRIDTTHFVCTEGRGRDWERAKEMNIPVVRPEWIEGCEREGRIVGVRGYYLDANPKDRQVGSNPSISAGTNAPQGSSVSSPSQGGAPGAGSHTNLPSRAAPPRISVTDSPVVGEPGPEVPPTPPPKHDQEVHRAAAAEEAEQEPPNEKVDEEEDEAEDESPTQSSHDNPSAEDTKEEEEGTGEMEEVSL